MKNKKSIFANPMTWSAVLILGIAIVIGFIKNCSAPADELINENQERSVAFNVGFKNTGDTTFPADLCFKKSDFPQEYFSEEVTPAMYLSFYTTSDKLITMANGEFDDLKDGAVSACVSASLPSGTVRVVAGLLTHSQCMARCESNPIEVEIEPGITSSTNYSLTFPDRTCVDQDGTVLFGDMQATESVTFCSHHTVYVWQDEGENLPYADVEVNLTGFGKSIQGSTDVLGRVQFSVSAVDFSQSESNQWIVTVKADACSEEIVNDYPFEQPPQSVWDQPAELAIWLNLPRSTDIGKAYLSVIANCEEPMS